MRDSARIRMVFLGLAAVLIQAGCSPKEPTPHYDEIVLQAQLNALHARGVLCEMRAGRYTNSLELLEQTIDADIILIDDNLVKLTGPDHDNALRTLQVLKAYREAYPRRRESTGPDTESFTIGWDETIKRASAILSKPK